MSDRQQMRPTAPVHTEIRSDKKYADMDPGIRYPVRLLNAHGIPTDESCQGGEGHACPRPCIFMPEPRAFEAMNVLQNAGVEVREVASIWSVDDGVPNERRWRLVLRRAMPERATDRPMFIAGHLHRDCWEVA